MAMMAMAMAPILLLLMVLELMMVHLCGGAIPPVEMMPAVC
jgi:hypothetical protein